MSAAQELPPSTKVVAPPTAAPSAGDPDHLGGQVHRATHAVSAPEGSTLPPGQRSVDTHATNAGSGDQLPLPASGSSLSRINTLAGGSDVPGDQTGGDLQQPSVSGATTSHSICDAQRRGDRCPQAYLRSDAIGLLASTVLDIETLRKAQQNRLALMLRPRDKADKDGGLRGLGMSLEDPQVTVARLLLEATGGKEKLKTDASGNIVRNKKGEPTYLKKYGSGGLEHRAILDLGIAVRAHPLWKAWAAHEKGIGEKQLGRLLGALGDPYWIDSPSLTHRPRRPSDLWSYCGYAPVDGVTKRRKKGEKLTWSPEAKMRAHLMVGSCIKAKGHYAEIYNKARAKYDGAIHVKPCERCTPQGRDPAPVGSVLTDGHQNGRAVRITAKEILKDIWKASRDIHLERDKDSLPTNKPASPKRDPSAGS